MVQRIAPTVAYRDAGFFGTLVDLFDQLLAAILRELRQHEANDLAVVGRIYPQVRFLNGFLDRSEHPAIPRLNEHHPRIRRADVGDAVYGRWRAVVVDLNAIEQCRGSAASAYRLQIVAEDLDRPGHLVFGGFDDVVKRVLTHWQARPSRWWFKRASNDNIPQ